MEKLEFTKQLVLDAGNLVRTMMAEDVEVSTKTSKADLVTNVDKAVEVFLVQGIQNEYENQVFLTEENTVESAVGDDMWIIDPIDGTMNFVHQKENFGISVAFFHKEEGVFGVVYDVIRDELFWGHVDKGAFVNDTPLRLLDQETKLTDSLITGDVFRPDLFKHSPEVMKPKFLTHRYLGSGALETSHVAKGKFAAYIFPQITIWDVAAGMILLKCVGGTWVFGDKIDGYIFDDKKRLFIGANNALVRDELLENI